MLQELTQEYEEKGKRLTEKEEHRLKKLRNIIDDVLLISLGFNSPKLASS
jgi:hypothetical protein